MSTRPRKAGPERGWFNDGKQAPYLGLHALMSLMTESDPVVRLDTSLVYAQAIAGAAAALGSLGFQLSLDDDPEQVYMYLFIAALYMESSLHPED